MPCSWSTNDHNGSGGGSDGGADDDTNNSWQEGQGCKKDKCTADLVVWHSNTFIIHLLVFDIGLGLLATRCCPVPPHLLSWIFSEILKHFGEHA